MTHDRNVINIVYENGYRSETNRCCRVCGLRRARVPQQLLIVAATRDNVHEIRLTTFLFWFQNSGSKTSVRNRTQKKKEKTKLLRSRPTRSVQKKRTRKSQRIEERVAKDSRRKIAFFEEQKKKKLISLFLKSDRIG